VLPSELTDSLNASIYTGYGYPDYFELFADDRCIKVMTSGKMAKQVCLGF
jgi:hypothetical protein